MKLTVGGGGNTAFALAAALKLRGRAVALFEAPEFAASIQPVLDAGGIHVHGVAGDGLAQIDLVTTDPVEAIRDAVVVFICVPAYAHQRMFDLIVPHLQEGQIVLLMPGNAGGALEFARVLKQTRPRIDLFIAEASSCLFACRKDRPDGIWIRGLKQQVPVAAFPAKNTATVVDVLQKIFPEFSAASHVLETGLTNTNHMVHPCGMLLNIGHIEQAKEDWLFFRIGLAPAACRVMEVMDRERVQIVAELGLPPVTLLEWMLRFYAHQGMKGATLYEAFSTSPVFAVSKAPRGIEHRYMTEDIPYGLVPIASLGRELGIKTPAIDTMISLASLEGGRDWWAEGRTAQKMGLAGMSAKQMIEFVIGHR